MAAITISTQSQVAYATCPGTVSGAEGAQTLTDNENCTIESTGSVSTAAPVEHGVQGNNGNTVTNEGSIETTGIAASGVSVNNNNTITNAATGVIDTDGIGASAIIGSNENTITNIGKIDTSGIGALGVEFGNDNLITNDGLIITSSSGAHGINVVDDNTVNNNSTIETSGTGSIGITAQDGNTVTNAGEIKNTGLNGSGISVNNNNTIVNRNSITVSGPFATGISANSDNSITNSGQIKAEDSSSYAINFEAGTNQLTLESGSKIIGKISLGDGADSVFFANGVSTVLTFDNDGNEIVESVATTGLPFVISGNTVAVLDQSGLAQQDEILTDLTAGVHNTVYARLNSHNSSIDKYGSVWVQGFGGLRETDDNGLIKGAKHELAGVLAGLDGRLKPGLWVGGFGGFASTDVKVKSNASETNYFNQEIDVKSYLGGAYASYRKDGLIIDVILTAGRSDQDSNRSVLYNLSSTGMQTAVADYDGTFVAPEVAIGKTFDYNGFKVQPSVRVRYGHMSLDGYQESGAADNLKVGKRDIEIWQWRAQLAFPMETRTDNIFAKFIPRFGVEGSSTNNEAVNAELLGESLTVSNLGDDHTVTGFIGFTTSVNVSDSVSAILDTEVHAGEDGFVKSEARAGMKIKF